MKNEYRIEGDSAFIIMNTPKHGIVETAVSVEDLPRLIPFHGSLYPIKDKHGQLRVQMYFADSHTYCQLHRFILNAPEGVLVDHVDHEPLNNRRSNLRLANASENTQNIGHVRSHNKLGITGVYYHKRTKKYLAYGYKDGKKYELGYYTTPEEAGEVASNWRAINHPYSSEAREIENPTLPELTHTPGFKNKSTGIKGITFNKRQQRYKLQLVCNGKLHTKGCYKTLEEAIEALPKFKQDIGYSR